MTKNPTPKPENHFPILYFDGGSRGNPGEAAGAAVIVMPDGQQYTVSQYIKVATNNEAEYTGLVIGLQKAIDLGIEELIVKGDSQLVINQVTGKWKVNSPHLKQFYNETQRLRKKIKTISIDWVRRHENHLADKAVNQCIDKKEKNTDKIKYDLEDNKNEQQFPFFKGDRIVISKQNNSLLKHQAVIVSEPNLSQEGHWIITIRVE